MEDIAVIGMACRFPGARNYQEFWQNLKQGVSSIEEIPKDRWDWRSYYGHPGKGDNKTDIKYAGFIEDMDKFDPLFFGISPREAAYMDPQHRIFLECAWHALEDSGYRPGALWSKRIGVYCGVSKNDYAEMMRERGVAIASYVSTGTVHSLVANRVSFFLDLTGGSEVVDTACSSSLVALDRAISAMHQGHCDGAIVGGVNAILSPTMMIAHRNSGMLSEDGKIRTFDAGANGYVRGEGVAALVIKPLAAAQQAADPIVGVIKSIGVNHGGRSNFLTAPSAKAQGVLIRETVAAAGIAPESITYIECHGTGTKLGDPLEIEGLKLAYAELLGEQDGKKYRGEQKWPFCGLSSVKPNIGHLEPLAGLAGLIKVLLALRHRELPGLVNYQHHNPYIDLTGSPFYILTAHQRWERAVLAGIPSPLCAGVSNFGMGGVNAHVIVEEYRPPLPKEERLVIPSGPVVIPLSAKNEDRLKEVARNLLAYLDAVKISALHPPTSEFELLTNIAYTLQVGRAVMAARLVFTAVSLDGLCQQLERYLLGHSLDEEGLPKRAKEWLAGNKEAFEQGLVKGRRIALPCYPFARRRCWFDEAADLLPGGRIPGSLGEADQDQGLEKGPSSASSTGEEVHYSISLKAHLFYLDEHHIQGERVMPGSAHFGFVYEALASLHEEISGVVFSTVYWLRPWRVLEDQVAEVAFIRRAEGASYDYVVRVAEVEYVKGVCSLVSDLEEEKLPYADGVFNRILSKGGIYEVLRAYGIGHGPRFQVMETIQLGDRLAVAHLKGHRQREALVEFPLNPFLVDGVFQAVTHLSLAMDEAHEKQHVPFYVEKVCFYDRLPDHCFVQVTAAAQKTKALLGYQMVVYDQKRRIIAVFKGFKKKALTMEKSKKQVLPDETMLEHQEEKQEMLAPEPHLLRYTTEWAAEGHQTHDELPEVVVCILSGRVSMALVRALPDSFIFLHQSKKWKRTSAPHYRVSFADAGLLRDTFRLIEEKHGTIGAVVYLVDHLLMRDTFPQAKDLSASVDYLCIVQALILSRLKGKVQLLGCLRDSDEGVALDRGMIGFARTLGYESPNFPMKVMLHDEGDKATLSRHLQDELVSGAVPMRLVRYREGRREVERVVPVASPRGVPGNLGMGKEGAIVIVGGAGGLGRLFAREITEHSGHPVALLGRRPATPAILDLLDTMTTAGKQVSYHAVDVREAREVETVLRSIRKQHQGIWGVIHAAGIIEDAFILRKDKDAFERVLGTKVLGCVNLDVATRKDSLDFFMVFSSIAGFMPNQGQSAYASGNCFLDAYMRRRRHWEEAGFRWGRSMALAWPLWEEGGMQVSAEEVRHLEEVFGMNPLKTSQGVALFHELWSASSVDGYDPILLIAGDQGKIERHLHVVRDKSGDQGSATAISEEEIHRSLRYFIRGLTAFHLRRILSQEAEAVSFFKLGITSSKLVSLTAMINRHCSLELNPSALFTYDTMEALSAHLLEGDDGAIKTRFRQKLERRRSAPFSLIDLEASAVEEGRFIKRLSTEEFFMQGHIYEGRYNFPGACYVEMALQVSQVLFKEVAGVSFSDHLFLQRLSSYGEPVTVDLQLKEISRKEGYAYVISQVDEETPSRNLCAQGKLLKGSRVESPRPRIRLQALLEHHEQVKTHDDIIEQMIAEGDEVDHDFIASQRIYVSGGEALGELSLSKDIEATYADFILHPSLLAGFMQTARVCNRAFNGTDGFSKIIPVGLERLELVARPPANCFAYVKRHEQEQGSLRKFDGFLTDAQGQVCVEIHGFSIKQTTEVEEKQKLDSASVQPVAKEVSKAHPVESIAAAKVNLPDVVAYLKGLLAPILGYRVEELEEGAPFESYVTNSVVIVELNRQLEASFGELSKTLFFEYESIAALGGYFVAHHQSELRALLGQEASPPPSEGKPSGTVSGGGVSLPDVVTYLKGLLAPILGYRVEELEEGAPFESYVTNSVVIVELNRQLEASFGALSKTLFFEYESIAALGGYFVAHHQSELRALLGQEAFPPPSEGKPSGTVSGGGVSLPDVVTYLKGLLAPILGYRVEELEEGAPFESYVTNSVVIVELNRQLEASFGALSKTLFFEYESIAALGGYFVAHHQSELLALLGREASPPPSEGKPSGTVSGGGVSLPDVVAYLKGLLAPILGHRVEELEEGAPFESYVTNSVVIVELNRQLEASFGALSKTLFFEYESIAALGGYFVDHHQSALPALLMKDSLLEARKEATSKQPASCLSPLEQAMARLASKEAVSNPTAVSSLSDSVHGAKDLQAPSDPSDANASAIAIIGLAGQYPDAGDMDQFWANLCEGKDSVREIPEGLFDYKKYFDPDVEQGGIYSRWGSFVADVDKFDPLFFNISPKEAALIDPQERLFLQVAYHTFEDAGYSKTQLSETEAGQVGVYVGAIWQHFSHRGAEHMGQGGTPEAPMSFLYSIANRVSYCMNLKGPSMAVDTACSSSLVALHLACQSLLSGENQMALAGGVNLSLSTSKYLWLCQNQFLSTDGKCRSFGAGGDGYVPGEGVGAVLLKPLKKAVQDRDHIYGVIRGISANHGGKSRGYTVPNPNAQRDLIIESLEKAKIDASTINYVEAHGTGTSLGDPIEITGLSQAFGNWTDGKQYCAIGSVKSNIGHLEASAGIAGLTKVLLQMKYGKLVPSLHAKPLNSNINFAKTPFKVQQELSDWQAIDGFPRRATVSSFGAGGSNAHVVMEEYQETIGVKDEALKLEGPFIIPLSAKNEARLNEVVHNLAKYLNDPTKTEQLQLPDLAYTLQVGREAMEYRLAMVVDDVVALKTQLEGYQRGKKEGFFTGNIKKENSDFVLSGPAGRDYLQTALAHKQTDALAQLWVKGVEIDWDLLYEKDQKPSKISLPTYPFARERYWILESEGLNDALVTSQLHPLVHENASDLSEQKYASVFSGKEWFLSDHQIQDAKVLPGVAYLEMAREAGTRSTHQPITGFRDVRWLRPLRVNGEPVSVQTAVFENKETVAYEIYSTIGKEEELLHGEGKLCFDPFPPRSPHDIVMIKDRLTHHIDGERLYDFVKKLGAHLRGNFQNIAALWYSQSEALSKINRSKEAGFSLQPSILDVAPQTFILGLSNLASEDFTPQVPFSVREVAIYGDINESFWCYARASDDTEEATISSYDVELLSASGDILVSFKDFLAVSIEGMLEEGVPKDRPEALDLCYYLPQWSRETITSGLATSSLASFIVLLGGSVPLAEVLTDRLGCEVQALEASDEMGYYARLQELIQSRLGGKVSTLMLVVYPHQEVVRYGFISGLLKTAALEHPTFLGKTIGVDNLSIQEVDALATLLEDEQAEGRRRFATGAVIAR